MIDSESGPHEERQPGVRGDAPLPTDLAEHVQAVFDVIGPYLDATLEDFEEGFRQEANPRDAVARWCGITAAWIAYHEQHLHNEVLPDEEETQLLGALIAISDGADDLSALGVPVETGRKLWACSDSAGEE